jgi:hypothetical protein
MVGMMSIGFWILLFVHRLSSLLHVLFGYFLRYSLLNKNPGNAASISNACLTHEPVKVH